MDNDTRQVQPAQAGAGAAGPLAVSTVNPRYFMVASATRRAR
jgi:hypothetical protein